MPEGNYRVEASVDTGPLAGMLRRSKEIEFK
jgi:hypothetical protein